MAKAKKSPAVIDDSLETIQHSFSHIMAMAVVEIFPEAKLAIGPAIEDGFYYDFELPRPLVPEDLPIIEKKMKKIIAGKLPFEKFLLSRKEALKLAKELKQPYKIELIEEIPPGEKISFYKTGNNFVDLCRGPHVKNTGEVPPSFKLHKIAGAYWRGDEKNKMLQRIYGVAFHTKKELKEYFQEIEEAKKRDHRKIGQEQELFSTDQEFGVGLILWHPQGGIIRHQIEKFIFETYLQEGYDPVYTPHIANIELWKKSGHWNFYRENMYSPFQIEDEEYLIKPMNCPGHVKIYNTRPRSYRELPLRWTELGTVYRYERSGVLHGLTRVRGFTQDDAHIFCTPEQLHEELIKMLELTKYILSTFGFKDYEVSLSIRDPQDKDKYLGNDKVWNLAEDALENALKQKNLDYNKYEGEAVFYGPKVDLLIKDALERKWQLSTIQVDFNLPERFEMSYIGEDGEEHTPIMLHRALLGSIERFMGILIEHYAGKFPVWLAPVQAIVIPITDRNNDYAYELAKKINKNLIRTEVNADNRTMSYKIRDAQKRQIPYMLIVGDREEEKGNISLRLRTNEDLDSQKIDQTIQRINEDIIERKIW